MRHRCGHTAAFGPRHRGEHASTMPPHLTSLQSTFVLPLAYVRTHLRLSCEVTTSSLRGLWGFQATCPRYWCCFLGPSLSTPCGVPAANLRPRCAFTAAERRRPRGPRTHYKCGLLRWELHTRTHDYLCGVIGGPIIRCDVMHALFFHYFSHRGDQTICMCYDQRTGLSMDMLPLQLAIVPPLCGHRTRVLSSSESFLSAAVFLQRPPPRECGRSVAAGFPFSAQRSLSVGREMEGPSPRFSPR